MRSAPGSAFRRALEASNDEVNAPRRAVNAALGYAPMPDLVGLQGPLVPPR